MQIASTVLAVKKKNRNSHAVAKIGDGLQGVVCTILLNTVIDVTDEC